MTPEELKKIIQSWYEGPVDLDLVYSSCDPDIIFHRPPFPPVVGIDANRKADEALYAAYTNSKVTIQELIVQGDVAILRYT